MCVYIYPSGCVHIHICICIRIHICVFADVLFSNSFFIYHYHLHLFVIMLRSTPAPRIFFLSITHPLTNGFWPFSAAKMYCVLFNANFWNVFVFRQLPFWKLDIWCVACWMQLRPARTHTHSHTHTSCWLHVKNVFCAAFLRPSPFIYIFFGYQAGNYLLFYFVVSWPG